MTDLTCDVAVIGAGTAGLAAERAARSQGASTLLIDDAFAGTTCIQFGCMPSKLLIAAADAAFAARHADRFGIRPSDVEIDGAAVMRRVHTLRDRFIAGVKAEFDGLPTGVKRKAFARFDGPGRLVLTSGETITAKAIVIATGARPSVPKFLDSVSDAVLTNETLFTLDDLPKSVGVIGAGPLGLELAQALARLGVDVAVFDEGDKLGGIEDAEIAKSLHNALEAEFPIHLGVKLSAEPHGHGVALSWDGPKPGSHVFERILAAAGRPPRLDKLGLETTGLTLDKHGMPEVNPATMQCADSPIFMAGDAAGDRPVLHEAHAEGAIAGSNAASFPKVEPAERMTPLSIMFTQPGLAVVGKIAKDQKTVCAVVSYADQGRAKVFATNAGVGKIHADAATGRLLHAQLVGPAVEHSAHLLALAIGQNMTATELLKMPFYHPTYEEGLKTALREICKATGSNQDDGFMPGA